ncbi:MAG: hypothetical protein HY260_19670 [Chloroflexi bacterium]|nr:hypothetical protein [Chloroflexota bacterium]
MQSENSSGARPTGSNIVVVAGSVVLIAALVVVAAISLRTPRAEASQTANVSAQEPAAVAPASASGQPAGLYIEAALEPTFALEAAKAVVQAGGMTQQELESSPGGGVFSVADPAGKTGPLLILFQQDGNYRTFMMDIAIEPFSARYLYEYTGALFVWRNGQWNQVPGR